MEGNLNNNKIYINARDLNKYLNYFGLRLGYSINDLEYKRYVLLKEKPDETEKINRIYEMLVTLVINNGEMISLSNLSEFNVEKYKTVYIENFHKSFYKFPEKKFIEYTSLNDLVNDIKNIVDSTKFQLENAYDKNIIRNINYNFYNDYLQAVNSFLDEYFKDLDEKNKYKASQVLDLVKEEYKSKIINYSLADLIEAINSSIIKGVNSFKLRKYAIKNVAGVVSLTDEYFKNETISNIMQKYYDKIDEFLDKQLEDFVNSIKINELENKEQADSKVDEFLNRYREEFSKFQDELSVRITNELMQESRTKYSSHIINNSVYHEIVQRLKNANQFQELSVIHDMVYPKKKDGELQII